MRNSNNGGVAESQDFAATQSAIKPRVQAVQATIVEFTKDLNENKKESQLLRSELATFEHQAVELNNETLKEIMEDVMNLESDFRKL